ncbi:conserved hypothetical protein [Trichinella spiralis]|nr:conserved hypothetical protein [Trichinella spiralis]
MTRKKQNKNLRLYNTKKNDPPYPNNNENQLTATIDNFTTDGSF